MTHYVISYDLHNQRTYQPVWNLLNQWGAAKLLESLWLVTLDAGAGPVRDALLAVVDADDSIAVIELKTGSDWASIRVVPAGLTWLKNNIHA